MTKKNDYVNVRFKEFGYKGFRMSTLLKKKTLEFTRWVELESFTHSVARSGPIEKKFTSRFLDHHHITIRVRTRDVGRKGPDVSPKWRVSKIQV